MINKKKSLLPFSWILKKRSILKAECLLGSSFANVQIEPPWRLLFFGSDNFSLYSLNALLKEYRRGTLIDKLEICTSVKKNKNEVHKFAEKENLRILPWPPSLTSSDFDIGLVVSFGHLIPRKIIEKFPLGMINIHASLLPRWRGAAPIIYALANGESLTGVSIMQIEPHKFDVGKLLSQKTFRIPNDMFMPALHKELGSLGSVELIDCLRDLKSKLRNAIPQSEDGSSYAPKVTSSFAHIDWNKMTSTQVFNLERALYSFMPLTSTWKGEIIKLINIRKCENDCVMERSPGFIIFDDKLKVLKVVCSDYKYVIVEKVKVYEKKIMSAAEFNNGYLKKASTDTRYFH